MFKKNIISAPVVKSRSEKLMKRALRDARKRIRKGELADANGFSLYLHTIDARFSSLLSDINNSTRVVSYTTLRAKKLAETRRLLDFFAQDLSELTELHQIVDQKAAEAGNTNDFKKVRNLSVDLTKLQTSFENLERHKI